MMSGMGHISYSRQFAYVGGKFLAASQYHKYKRHIVHLVKKKVENHYEVIRNHIFEFYKNVLGILPDSQGILDIDCSYDSTWHTRGHNSTMGGGVVIETNTGTIMDGETFGKICPKHIKHKNMLKKGKISQKEFDDWETDHVNMGECDKNYDHLKASGDMEKEAAKKMWGRSIQKHKMRYLTMVSDGDTGTFKALTTLNPHGKKKVRKVECVNHVGKRMATALKRLLKLKVLKEEVLDDEPIEWPEEYTPEKSLGLSREPKIKQNLQ